MQFKIGYRMEYRLEQPVPMIAMLNVHYTRFRQLLQPDHMLTSPGVPLDGYRDSFGNWCTRFTAPVGLFAIECDTLVNDDGGFDPVHPEAVQHAIEELPSDTIVWLLGSRYCETDVLSEQAWSMFQNTAPGWPRVQAICDYVHHTIRFDYMQASSTRTAARALSEKVGVCRDFTHAAIALCRCMNIPARYCTGYLSDMGQPEPYPAGDFAAWMEVYLGGAWHVFDPRNNEPRKGRVLIARGRDAADVPLIQSFGPSLMTGFKVWADEVKT